MQLFSPLSEDYPIPASEFESQVFAFCRLWKSGQSHFEFMTSGSTGTPKPILMRREAMIASAHLTGNWLHLAPNDVALLCLPIHYIAGAMVLVRALVLDLRVCIVDPNVNPLQGLEPISIQLASFVPNQWYTLLKSDVDFAAYFAHVKGVLLGGASLSPWIIQASQTMSFPIFLTYGMTETVSHVAYQTISPVFKEHFTLFPEVDFQISETGCGRFKGQMTDNEWVQTNDLVEQIGTHEFRLLGRIDRVINSAGRKIHAERVEESLVTFFPERSFFVGAVPDDSFGQKAILFIEGLEEISENILNPDFLPALAAWEIPKSVVYLPKFETTPSGKMDRLKSVALYLNSQK
jgi:O-succinylbenzoic acid--CoA ligase